MTSPEPPVFDTGPGPGKGAFIIAYALTVASGVLGAVIGYGLVEVQTEGDRGVWLALGALIGGIAAAGGVGVVAVLTLRAMAEWRRPRP
ncbi:MAG: hypothetical protein ACKO72_05255 [Actinomycetes bacterium]